MDDSDLNSDPMPRLLRMANIYEASVSAFPQCGCHAHYGKRLFRKGAAIPEPCSKHKRLAKEMKKKGETE